ncbi:hypothetical protein [Herbaspirillum sp. CAH-3]|jgi:hypothetical protein|uniref:hypothetical protein n=1 Tax=Herbaspirillum sp. CAH-3 TaxID=2605746 RepID=UPI0012AC67C1|nr:hypothetical protein [Herbaspirillum sp. CAH-3]MRT27837.1 hypothetical protein [Herbaspirillum sp. CAH-3]
MVSCYEITADSSPFTFLVWCAANDAQWFVSGVEIRHSTIGKLFPKRSLPGRYSSRPLALARGIHWCECVAHQLLEAEVPDVPAGLLPPAPRIVRELR